MNFPLPLLHSAPLKDTKDLLIVNFSSHFSIFTLLDLSATMSNMYHSLLPEIYYLSGFPHPILLLFLFYMLCHFVFFLVFFISLQPAPAIHFVDPHAK